MSNIENLNISQYIGKTNGQSLPASDWNSLFTTIKEKVDEIVLAVNASVGGTPNNSSVLWIEDTPYYSSPDNPLEIDLTNTLVSDQTNGKGKLITNGVEPIIKGTLYGNIKISLATAPNDDLRIRLDGVTIINQDDKPAIDYNITALDNTGFKGLVVSLNKDTVNHILNMNNTGHVDNQKGAINSDHDLTLKGVGYLSIINKCGHGIKGSDVKIAGPHIYIKAVHDGIHGKKVNILDGVFKFDGVRDGFGISDNGQMLLLGGKIIEPIVDQDLFDLGQDANLYYTSSYQSISARQDVQTNTEMTTKGDNINQITNNTTAIKGYSSSQDIKSALDGDSEIVGTDLTNNIVTIQKDIYGDGQTVENVQAIELNSHFIILEGNINYPLIVPDTIEDATIYLNGVNIFSEYIPCIYYKNSSGRLKVIVVEDTINYLSTNYPNYYNINEDGIKSENNMELEIKDDSYLIIHGANDGIDAGELKITDSGNGSLFISKCTSRGIKANTLIVGPDANIKKSGITYYTDPSQDTYSEAECLIIVKNNCVTNSAEKHTITETEIETPDPNGGEPTYDTEFVLENGYADIYCRQGSKTTKGKFGTKKGQFKGALITDTIGGVIQLDFDNSNNIYYKNCLTPENVVSNCGKTYENYLVIPNGSTPLNINNND